MIKAKSVEEFKEYLLQAERSSRTAEQYAHVAALLTEWLGRAEPDNEKNQLLGFKEHLKAHYAPASVNAAIAAVNSFMEFSERPDLKLRAIRRQKNMFADKDRELTKAEYSRLCKAALKTGNDRLYHILITLSSVGVRVSELQYITVEAVRERTAYIDNKGKLRIVLLPNTLCKQLEDYTERHAIKSGCIFITRRGKPLDNSNLLKEMKKLAEIAKVDKQKVFPHNFRHLFARNYYSAYKDIVRLADILGHSSIDTTRIYTKESGDVHRRQLDKLCLDVSNR